MKSENVIMEEIESIRSIVFNLIKKVERLEISFIDVPKNDKPYLLLSKHSKGCNEVCEKFSIPLNTYEINSICDWFKNALLNAMVTDIKISKL